MLPDAESFRRLVDGRQRGPAATVLRAGLTLASWPYAAAVGLRNRAFDAEIVRVDRPPLPVVSVGNLTVGGTGKTPLVAWLAAHAAARGWRPAIVSRGYGAAAGQLSDEAAELGLLVPGVPHHASRRRIEAVEAAERGGATLAILDDGFQHRRLARSVNLLVIDATDPFGCGRLLPRGLLREPLGSIARADGIVLTRADRVSDATRHQIQKACWRHLGRRQVPWFETAHRPRELRSADGQTLPLGHLAGRSIYGFSGIGNPAPFRASLEEQAATLVGFATFPDHHPYSAADVSLLADKAAAAGADLAVTTLKDLVKLPPTGLGEIPLVAVVIGLEFTSDTGDPEQLLAGLPEP